MTDDSNAATGDTPQPIESEGRYAQRNLAERLFPGPSRGMSRQRSEHLERLLRSPGEGMTPGVRLGRPSRSPDDASRPDRPRRNGAPLPADPVPAPADDTTPPLRETLEQQNELLRAILSSTIDTQTDARSTAQNSRTFAWAGTAIAFLTFVATVVLIVEAIQAQ